MALSRLSSSSSVFLTSPQPQALLNNIFNIYIYCNQFCNLAFLILVEFVRIINYLLLHGLQLLKILI